MGDTPGTMRIRVRLTAPADTTFADGVFTDQVGQSFAFLGQRDSAVLRGAAVADDGRSVELELEVPVAAMSSVDPPGSFSIGIVQGSRFDGLFPDPYDAG